MKRNIGSIGKDTVILTISPPLFLKWMEQLGRKSLRIYHSMASSTNGINQG